MNATTPRTFPPRVGERRDDEQRSDEGGRDPAGEVNRPQDAPLCLRRPSPATDQQDDHPDEDRPADDREQRLERVGNRLAVVDHVRVGRAVVAVGRVPREEGGQDVREDRDQPDGDHRPALELRPQPAVREGEHEVDERGEEQAAREGRRARRPSLGWPPRERSASRVKPTRTSSRPVPFAGRRVQAIRPLTTNESPITGKAIGERDRARLVVRPRAITDDPAATRSITGNSPNQSRWERRISGRRSMP